MHPGSLIRFITGLLLAISVIASYFGSEKSVLSLLLAVIFVALTAIWIVFRF